MDLEHITMIHSNGTAARVHGSDPEFAEVANAQARVLERQARAVRPKSQTRTPPSRASASVPQGLDAEAVKMFPLLVRSELRRVLVAIAVAGVAGIDQVELLKKLGVTPYQLRARLGGLATVAKHVGVKYPVRKSGNRLTNRRFWLDDVFGASVLTLDSAVP